MPERARHEGSARLRLRIVNVPTCATLLLIIEPTGLWTAAASVRRGAAWRLGICERPSQRPPPPFSQVPERCFLVWMQDHSDSFRWRTLLIVYLSAKAFHHFGRRRASCFNKLGGVRKKGAAYASQSSASYFILLQILNKTTAFDPSD